MRGGGSVLSQGSVARGSSTGAVPRTGNSTAVASHQGSHPRIMTRSAVLKQAARLEPAGDGVDGAVTGSAVDASARA